MGFRFRKSVKIAKGVKLNLSTSGASVTLGGRGHSVNIGSKGARATVGIPGTGISYTTKLGGPVRKPRQSYSPAAMAPERVTLTLDDRANILVQDANGYPITDEYALRRIRASESYRTQKQALESERRRILAGLVQDSAEETAKFLSIASWTPVVESRQSFEYQYAHMVPEVFDYPAPERKLIEAELTAQAEATISAPFWKVKKDRAQFVQENLEPRYAAALAEWQKQKADAEAWSQRECDEKRRLLNLLIQGDYCTICDEFDAWIGSCELPVEININYELDTETGTMYLDVDLPEIEDLPDTRFTITESGALKEKKKTQADKRKEYATCVFGLAVFITANAFNMSPVIRRILIAGYTQRRDSAGSLNDDYIYSIKFPREAFEGKNVAACDPSEFCMQVENRCNPTSTALFKSINPFDSYD